MPDFTAGNQATTMVDEAVSAITSPILPEVHPPSAPNEANVQGDHRVMSRPPSVPDGPVEVPAQVRPADSPDDRGVPLRYPGDLPVPPDTPGGNSRTGRESFATDNDEAIPTFERASEAWTSAVWQVTGNTQVIGRQKGRSQTTLYVPATDEAGNAITGVRYGPTESALQGPVNTCSFLLAGASVSIPSEAPIWVAPLSGNATGYVIVMTTDNPSGGQLGGL